MSGTISVSLKDISKKRISLGEPYPLVNLAGKLNSITPYIWKIWKFAFYPLQKTTQHMN